MVKRGGDFIMVRDRRRYDSEDRLSRRTFMERMALLGIGTGALGGSAPAFRRPAVAQQHASHTHLQHQTEGKKATSMINDDPVKGFAHAYTVIEGFRVHYVSGGEGPPVLLI